MSSKHHDDDRAGGHELDQRVIEGFAFMHGVELFCVCLRKSNGLQAANDQARFLDLIYYPAGEFPSNSVRLNYSQCIGHKNLLADQVLDS